MRARTYPASPVLLVDDEEGFVETVRRTLSAAGINNIVTCNDSRDVVRLVAEHAVGVTLLDVMMPNISGREVLGQLAADYPQIPVIMVTAVDEVDSAVAAIQAGAFDYLVKPVDDRRLVTAVQRAIRMRSIQDENLALKRLMDGAELEQPESFAEIVTHNATMLSIFRYLESVARTPLPILVTGETGVGKELVVRAIHAVSGREGDLVEVNVAGVDDAMLADALFGHRKGAFTGADSHRAGLVEKAAGGTLFLDEIGDLSASSQVKLLRLLQEGTYYPVGSDVARLTDARVVAATNREPASLRHDDAFRRDLYFRLTTHHVHVPPLRQRRDDIPVLVDHFVAKSAKALGAKPPRTPPELLTLLSAYDFPGNVRELEGMVFDAISHHRGGTLSTRRFAEKMGLEEQPSRDEPTRASDGMGFPDSLPTLRQAEEGLVDEAMRRAEGNQTVAARLLGVSRQALNNRLRRRKKE